MYASWIRYLAMVCAALALGLVATWVLDRAPAPPQDTGGTLPTDEVRYRILLDFTATAADAAVLKDRLGAAGFPSHDVPPYESRTVSFPFLGEERVGTGHVLTDPGLRPRQLIVTQDYTFKDAVVAAAAIDRTFPHVKHFIGIHYPGTNPYLYFHLGRDGIGRALIWALGLTMVSAWPSTLALVLLAASISVAALLGFFLLLKGRDAPAIRTLGAGLGFWSLGLAELWIYSVVPTFDRFQPVSLGMGMATDTAAFLSLLAAGVAFVGFWRAFPRPVTETELDAYLVTLDAARSRAVDRVKARLSRYLSRPATSGSRPRPRSGLARLGILLLVLLAASLWRGGFLIARSGTLWGAVPLLPLAALVLIVYAPGVVCLRLFKFHSAVGTADERRKVEWVRAGLWMGFVAFVIPLVGLGVLYLLRLVFPEVDLWIVWGVCLVIFGLLSGPLFVMGALALSILYRGTVDPRLALRGLTLWSVMGVLLTLVFVLLERSIALRLVGLLNLPPQSGYIAAGAIVAGTFQPVRKYTERKVNRFVERVLPESVLASGKSVTAAIAVVDISGFTALSAKDQPAALLASAVVQKEARRVADVHGGRVVKSTGDGVILCFPSAERAADATLALHAGIKIRAAALDLTDLKLHSGLHCGEIMEMHDGDIYGQTVNITARIADWASAGEIGMSEVFSAALPAPLPGFESPGPQRFKDVPDPVTCFKRRDA